MSRESRCFGLIGSGRVASAIGPALVQGGMRCVWVYSPTREHAERLAKQMKAEQVANKAQLARLSTVEVDFVLVTIKDDAISEVVKLLPSGYEGVVLHTSGGTALEALQPLVHRGVFYPMQTFSPDRLLDISAVPIFPEASDDRVREVIEEMLQTLQSRSVRYLTSEERVKLHLASVFACNFVNHLYALSSDVMKSIGLDFTYLAPLVRETLDKAQESGDPQSVQTGPAVRSDQKTIERHLTLLEGYPAEVYRLLTASIAEASKEGGR